MTEAQTAPPIGELQLDPTGSGAVNEHVGHLKEGMTMIDVVALGISATVGVSIFSVIAPAAAVAGPGMLITLAMAAVPMVIFAVVYAFMGSTVPRSGSSFDWPAQFVHPYLGFIVTWLRILGNAVSLHVMALVFVNYVSKALPLPAGPTMFGLLTVFCVVNWFGITPAAKTGRVLVLLKVLALGVFVVAGIPFVRAVHFVPLMPHGWWGVLAALPLLVGLYTGIESSAEVGEEIRNSASVIGKGLALTVCASMALYVAISVVAIGVLGTPQLARSGAALFDAGRVPLGRWNAPLLIITAAAAIGTAINATILIFTRFLFAMGRDGALPAVLAKIHPKWGTPYVAVIAVFVSGTLSLLLPQSLLFLFLAANLPTVLKYLSNCLAALRLVDRYPELHERAHLKLSRRAVKGWSYAGVVCAVVILLSGWNADWRAYAILIIWGALGSAYWFSRARYRSKSMQTRGYQV